MLHWAMDGLSMLKQVCLYPLVGAIGVFTAAPFYESELLIPAGLAMTVAGIVWRLAVDKGRDLERIKRLEEHDQRTREQLEHLEEELKRYQLQRQRRR